MRKFSKNLLTLNTTRNYSFFNAVGSELMKEVKKVEKFASDIDKDKMITQGTDEAIDILRRIDDKVKKDNIQVTVGFNIGFFSVSLTSSDVHNQSIKENIDTSLCDDT